MSIDEYFKKRENVQMEEDKRLAIDYYERFNKVPPKEIFHEYFMLFSFDEDIKSFSVYNEKINQCDNRAQSISYVNKYNRPFDNFEDFIKFCLNKDRK